MLKEGYTLMHEHVTIDLSGVKKDEDCHLDCYEETVKEFKKLYEYGVRNVVEVTNIGMGRDIAYIQNVEKETGIHIVKSTGCYKVPFIPEEMTKLSTEELAEVMVREIEEGFAGFSEQAQMIGEIGTSNMEWKPEERKLFDAAILAHKKTGKPIYTHTTLSTLALEQAQYLVENGVNPQKVVIGHIDLSGNLETIVSVLETGVNVGFDTIGKNNYLPDEKRIEMLIELEKLGYLGQVVLSEDLTRKTHLKYKGGIGYTYLFETFLPKLREAGMQEGSIDMMLKKNPQKIMDE